MQSRPHVLEWQNVSFSVKLSKPGLCAKKVEKTILENISGRIHSGMTCAIMGPSGKLLFVQLYYTSLYSACNHVNDIDLVIIFLHLW